MVFCLNFFLILSFFQTNFSFFLCQWERWGQAKICVKVNSEAELLEIQMAARALSLVNYVVQDAGRTQIESGSLTVLAIGPVAADTVDQLTGHLKLL